MTPHAIAFDAFGTLIRYGVRLAPYRRLLHASRADHTEHLPFLTRNVPAATFAAELGVDNVMTHFEHELAEELAGLHLFDDVPNVLCQARDAGLRIAVCSNLAAEYGTAVRRLLPELDAYILSYEVGVTKPDAAIYAATCSALSCAPHEVLFVGDSRRCDYYGPQTIGMPARWLNRKGGQTLSDALDGVL